MCKTVRSIFERKNLEVFVSPAFLGLFSRGFDPGPLGPLPPLGSLTALSSLLLLPFSTLYAANLPVRVNTVYSIHPLMESFLLLVWNNWKAKLTPMHLCRLPQCTATPHTYEGWGKDCPAPTPHHFFQTVFHFLITSFLKEDNSGGWFQILKVHKPLKQLPHHQLFCHLHKS